MRAIVLAIFIFIVYAISVAIAVAGDAKNPWKEGVIYAAAFIISAFALAFTVL